MWDDDFGGDDSFGTEANPFIQEQATLIPPNSEILELGAGDGRNSVYLAELGHNVTAIDDSAARLGTLKSLAAERRVSIRSVHRDVLEWEPGQEWDALVMTFLDISSDQLPELFQKIQTLLAPGGYYIGLLEPGPYGDGDPDEEDAEWCDELDNYFEEGKVLRCERAERPHGVDREEERVIEFIFQKEL